MRPMQSVALYDFRGWVVVMSLAPDKWARVFGQGRLIFPDFLQILPSAVCFVSEARKALNQFPELSERSSFGRPLDGRD